MIGKRTPLVANGRELRGQDWRATTNRSDVIACVSCPRLAFGTARTMLPVTAPGAGGETVITISPPTDTTAGAPPGAGAGTADTDTRSPRLMSASAGNIPAGMATGTRI